MTVNGECYKCGTIFHFELGKEEVECPNCHTIFNMTIVVNEKENQYAMELIREKMRGVKE